MALPLNGQRNTVLVIFFVRVDPELESRGEIDREIKGKKDCGARITRRLDAEPGRRLCRVCGIEPGCAGAARQYGRAALRRKIRPAPGRSGAGSGRMRAAAVPCSRCIRASRARSPMVCSSIAV